MQGEEWQGCQFDHSHLSSDQFKNEWSYAPALLCAFMAWAGITTAITFMLMFNLSKNHLLSSKFSMKFGHKIYPVYVFNN